jgi:hypothetical protein
MLELRGKLYLEPEAVGLHFSGDFRREHLDCDYPTEGAVVSHEHAAHAAAVKLTVEGVRVPERSAESLDQLRQR